MKLRRQFLDRLGRMPPEVRDRALIMAHHLHQTVGLPWGRAANLAADRAEMWARRKGMVPVNDQWKAA